MFSPLEYSACADDDGSSALLAWLSLQLACLRVDLLEAVLFILDVTVLSVSPVHVGIVNPVVTQTCSLPEFSFPTS
jgi:hypothetical protein